jgi:hypothetical protein
MISNELRVTLLRYSRRRFFVGPDMPNSAARWPYLTGPATAANKYEEAPHDADEVNNQSSGLSDPSSDFPHTETAYRFVDVFASFERLHT